MIFRTSEWPGVGASPPVRDALFPARRQAGGITTGVALHNLESSPGLVRCDAVGEGRFSAVALEMDPGTRTFITLPVVPVAERMSQE